MAPASASAAATPAPTPAAPAPTPTPAPAPVAAPAPAVVEALFPWLPQVAGPAACAHRVAADSIPHSFAALPNPRRHTRELDGIAGSGSEGRVTKDILAYIASRGSAAATRSVAPPASLQPPTADGFCSGQDSCGDGPHAQAHRGSGSLQTSRSARNQLRRGRHDKNRGVAEAQQGRLRAGTRNEVDLHAAEEAIVKAMQDFPGVNASVDGDRIITRSRSIWAWRRRCHPAI